VDLLLAVLTLLLGQSMGIFFGLNEDLIKSHLSADATEVQNTIYQDNQVAMKAVLTKSWTYMPRAHLHAGGMGTTAVALILVLCVFGASRVVTTLISLALGESGLGYSIFWMWAGLRSPALEGTGAAEESLEWLAVPSSGGFVAAAIAVFVAVVAWMLAARRHEDGLEAASCKTD